MANEQFPPGAELVNVFLPGGKMLTHLKETVCQDLFDGEHDLQEVSQNATSVRAFVCKRCGHEELRPIVKE